jgi:hypothetical protein
MEINSDLTALKWYVFQEYLASMMLRKHEFILIECKHLLKIDRYNVSSISVSLGAYNIVRAIHFLRAENVLENNFQT